MPLGLAGAATGIGGALIKKSSNDKSAEAVTEAANVSDATARYIYDDTVQRNAYRDSIGNAALGKFDSMYNLTGTPQGTTGQAMPTQGTQFGSQGFGFNVGDALRRDEFMQRPGQQYATAPADMANFRGVQFGNNPNGFQGFGGGTPNPAAVSGLAPQTAQMEPLDPKTQFSDFYSSPDYQLAFTEGQDAIEGSAAARGGLLSGNTAKAITGFGQDLATSTFGNYKNTLNNIAGMGQQANQAVTNAGQQYSAQFGNNQAMAANAQAQRAQANGNLFGNIGMGFAQGVFG